MKHESVYIKIFLVSSRLKIFPALLILYTAAHSQQNPDTNTIKKIDYNLSVSSPDRSHLVYPSSAANKKMTLFLDSLKIKSSKSFITKKIYDYIVISPDARLSKNITSTSDINYLEHSGKRIRNIKINRLNVFGSDINYPAYEDPNKIEKLLNKTHINTNENIIRKNLLFSEGDTISPLELSDNERIIRQLPFIDDARIIVFPVSENEADILILTKDVYSLGAELSFSGIKKGYLSAFDRNIFGIGHEFGIEIPYDSQYGDSPGFGIRYLINNIKKSFVNLNLFYFDSLGKKTYGFDISRQLVSSSTKYAGGISVRRIFTNENLDTLSQPQPLRYNTQDYWFSRSFLLDRNSVTRLILGTRYFNNNVYDRPLLSPDSYHYLQRYKMFLGSASLSIRKFYKANLIYGYGHTEDIPYGGIVNITAGKEQNEFKDRLYTGINFAFGESIRNLGYFHSSVAFSSFFNKGQTEQGLLLFRTNFVSNLLYFGKFRVRNFINIDYTRGFDRYTDEYLVLKKEYGFSGFNNDSIGGTQRISLGIESVFFSPKNYFGFKYAFFGFADLGFLFNTNEFPGNGYNITGIGIGIRIGNDNLVFKTFQIRLGFFPDPPAYSKINYLLITGEPKLKPFKFDPGPPSIISYN